MLVIENLCAGYGDVQILRGVSLQVRRGEVVTLLGRNGMGKSTTIRCIAGLLAVSRGDIRFQDASLRGLKPHQVAGRGIGLVPEDRRVFPSLTVLENLKLPTLGRARGGWDLDKVLAFFPRLQERRRHKGNELSGGEQQMLAIARVLRMRAELVLLDEPSEGLAPLLVREIENVILEMKKEGITILLVEQNTACACRVADRHYVLSHGEVVYSGSNQEFMADVAVKKLHLGV